MHKRMRIGVPSASIARAGDARIAAAAKARHSSPTHVCACRGCMPSLRETVPVASRLRTGNRQRRRISNEAGVG